MGVIDGGQIFAGGAVTHWQQPPADQRAYGTSSQWLEFNVTNSLSDDGGFPSTRSMCAMVLHVRQTRCQHDLQHGGLFFRAHLRPVNHVWASQMEMKGGRTILPAMWRGSLTLSPEGFDPAVRLQWRWGRVTVSILDLLDLSGLSDYASQLQIDPN